MRYLIIGGTGTLGQCLARKLAKHDVIIYSRDEQKQQSMRQQFPNFRYVLGDIRDFKNTPNIDLASINVILHLAAIKHVEVAENNPLESIKTNVLGAVNVAEAAMAARVPYVVFCNTDKSFLPITTYGYGKALAQNYMLAQNKVQTATRFSSFAWGNILASRGSAIPQFAAQVLAGETVTITDMQMSRFWLKIEDAADFMLANYERAPLDRAMIPPIKGATVVRIVESLARLLRRPKPEYRVIGMRGVEKLHEVLETTHERCLRSDNCAQYSDEELDSLLKDCV